MKSDFRTFLDLPRSILRPLNVDEVAAIVDVDRKVLFRIMKEVGLPKFVLSRSKKAVIGAGPMLKPIACPIVHFDLTNGHLVSPRFRGQLLREIADVARASSNKDVIKKGILRVDLAGSVAKTVARMASLARAEAAVLFDAEIRGGLPVMRGTRIGVYELADLCKFETVHYILESFPSLSAEHLEQASLYARAHPLRNTPD